MDDLISRQAAIEAFDRIPLSRIKGLGFELLISVSDAKDMLEGMKAVDAAPVKHGRWEPSEKYFGYNKCSVCADCYIDPEWAMNGKWHYCPNCGAKMDLDG